MVISAGVVAVAVLIRIANTPRSGRTIDDPGLTTEVAMLVMFGVGVLAGTGERALAVVLGATTAVLLDLRPELHSFASRISAEEMRAVMQFVVISLIVLPVLPDQNWGPYGAINPRRIWWMVVLITGFNLGSYLGYRQLGDAAGTVVAGILGGMISSTATTVSAARGSRHGQGSSAAGIPGLVIQIASTVVFARVLVLMALAAPSQFQRMMPLPAGMLGIMTVLAGIVWWRNRGSKAIRPAAGNPSELAMALTFAGMFVLVLLAVSAAKAAFGNRGLYGVAILSGLTDMDAITLSTSQLAERGEIDGAVAGRVILVAALSNLVFKAGAVAVLGNRDLARRIALLFGAAGVGGSLLLAFG